ncbi:hypothetical protein AGOR_G00080480 [Albula goreensis]|uniref:Periphilin-1 C-terminal domain-containing protein n=1 Tax=Albula goreensis TaxID=1534307 RepID=A0A8T3DKY5_9TELE|nr:hypothetical protein AGOR_G00080480 [Albula goreensis]
MSSSRHREREEASDKKQSKEFPSCPVSKHTNQDERRPCRRSRSPSLLRTPFRSRFAGRYYRSWFKKDERFFRRPGFSFRFQRQHTAAGSRFHPRGPPPGQEAPSPLTTRYEDVDSHVKSSPCQSKEYNDCSGSARSTSKEKDLKSLSFMISQEREATSNREPPSSVSRAAARNQAIQQKRREIEEVYRQDCETVGIVVKMLIAKDPTLERPIQSSLQENLREIGTRCVEAMDRFIQDYDSQDASPSITP